MSNYWQNKKVLVTGGAGFIGSHAALELFKKKSKVTIVVSTDTKLNRLRKIYGLNLEKIIVKKIDLTNFDSFKNVTKDQEIVLNFAGLDGGSKFKVEHSAEIFRINNLITLNLLESCRINKVNKVLIMSSIDIYTQKLKSPIREDQFLINSSDDLNGYSMSKIFSEIAAKLYFEQYGLQIAIARSGNVYGPGDYSGLEKGRVIPTFILNANENKDIKIWGDADQKKSFIYVTDLIENLLNLTKNYSNSDPVNIAGKKYVSLLELANKIIQITESDSKASMLNVNKINKKERKISLNKANKVIKFYEKTSLEEGLKNIIYSEDKKNEKCI